MKFWLKIPGRMKDTLRDLIPVALVVCLSVLAALGALYLVGMYR